MRIPLCVSAAGALSLLCAAAQPETVWRLDLTRPEVVAQLQGAELLPDGGPGGQPAIRLRGPAKPTLLLRTESFRDAVVSIRAKVKGHRQSQAFGECLHLRAAYPIRHREDWLYRPPAVRPLEAPDWQDYAITCHIPAYAGDFLLVFGHAGQDGDVLYSDVRLDRLPDPTPRDPQFALQAPQRTTHRGATVGPLSQEEDFRAFAQDWGGNLIRWQFTGGPQTFTTERYRAWIQENIDRLDAVLPFCRRYGIRVIIDLHRGPGEMNYLMNNLGVWTPETQDLIAESWRRIATHYRGNPLIYGYDLLNEPVDSSYSPDSGALDWHRLAERLAGDIRDIDPETPIIVQPISMGMLALKPLNFPNIIYSPHIYEPGEYTHQGVGSGRGKSLVYPDPSRGWNRDWLRQLAKPIRDFQLKYRVPICVGEFGVARWAEGGEQWLDDWISIFEEYGWDWTFHAYREASVWNPQLAGDRQHPRPEPNSPRWQVLVRHLRKNRR